MKTELYCFLSFRKLCEKEQRALKQIIAFEPISRYNVDNAKESDCYERKSSESGSGDGSAGV